MFIRVESEGKEEMWAWESAVAASVLDEENEGEKLSSVRYLECGPPLDKLIEAPRCMCLQKATAGFAKKGQDVKEGGGDRDALAAGECYRVLPFQSTVCRVQVVWTSIAVHPFPAKLP